MGKLTDALKKAADERMQRIDKINRVQEQNRLVVKKMGDSKVDPRVVSYFDPKALITEQYKILRTNILALNKAKPPKVLVMTSSIHTEGKTVSALNLAVTLAQSVQKPRVLLIDADMRRGRVMKYLGVEAAQGLTEILSEQISADEAMFQLDIDNLSFITAGTVPDNPAELLGADSMRRLLADMRTRFDHIIIDTPPIISVTDAGIIGELADGVVMVIQAGRTQRGIVKRAKELLHQSHAHILGYVLTNIEYHLPEYIYRYL